MPSSNKTPNLQLSQFLGSDYVLENLDYNADMLKLDTEIIKKLNITALLSAILAIDGHGSGIDSDKLDGAELSTDGTFASNSDLKVPSEKATNVRIKALIAALVDSSPAALDTLKELATALGNDPNFATTITNLIGTKIEKSAFTAVNDILVGTGAGTYSKKTPAEIKSILGLSTAETDIATHTTKIANHETRISDFETKGIIRTVIADTAFPTGATVTFPIILEPQYIRIITTVENAVANIDVALDTPLAMNDNYTWFREYIVEIFSVSGNLKFRRIKDVDTSDHPFNVTVTSDAKIVVYSDHPDHNHILIISEKMI